MMKKLMVLPAKDPKAIRLVQIPEDFEGQEVFRYVTGLIARVEEENPAYSWDDVAVQLEDCGFEILDFMLGPELS